MKGRHRASTHVTSSWPRPFIQPTNPEERSGEDGSDGLEVSVCMQVLSECASMRCILAHYGKTLQAAQFCILGQFTTTLKKFTCWENKTRTCNKKVYFITLYRERKHDKSHKLMLLLIAAPSYMLTGDITFKKFLFTTICTVSTIAHTRHWYATMKTDRTAGIYSPTDDERS